jgi:hypothetical protein
MIMLAYQFEAVIENGSIKVPKEYLHGSPSKVKVLLLPNSSRVLDKTAVFPDLKLRTKGIQFNREDAHER